MDKYGSIDQNWYSSENQKHEREKATEALKQMKELEKQYENPVLWLLKEHSTKESENGI